MNIDSKCVQKILFLWKWLTFLYLHLAWQHNRCLDTKCFTVLRERILCTFDMTSSEMDSLQNLLSVEYKCSIFLVEVHYIIFQSTFEVERDRSQPFYFNVKFDPPISANQKWHWNYEQCGSASCDPIFTKVERFLIQFH